VDKEGSLSSISTTLLVVLKKVAFLDTPMKLRGCSGYRITRITTNPLQLDPLQPHTILNKYVA
jgi:hypothetical protein